jgi:hypothetical protein
MRFPLRLPQEPPFLPALSLGNEWPNGLVAESPVRTFAALEIGTGRT